MTDDSGRTWHVSDRRRIDPVTYEVRQPQEPAPAAAAYPEGGNVTEKDVPAFDDQGATDPASDAPATGAAHSAEAQPDGDPAAAGAEPAMNPILAAKVAELEELANERTADLQRIQAEYVNYKKRVDRDRDHARQSGIEAVMRDVLPVLDALVAANEAGELVGGFKLVADEIQRVTTKYGLQMYGQVGDAFDPNLHEALMRIPYEGDMDATTVSAVMQAGFKLGDRVIRAARVGVDDPQ